MLHTKTLSCIPRQDLRTVLSNMVPWRGSLQAAEHRTEVTHLGTNASRLRYSSRVGDPLGQHHPKGDPQKELQIITSQQTRWRADTAITPNQIQDSSNLWSKMYSKYNCFPYLIFNFICISCWSISILVGMESSHEFVVINVAIPIAVKNVSNSSHL